jgi:hypothetical protein
MMRMSGRLGWARSARFRGPRRSMRRIQVITEGEHGLG